ncbi:hypothetical protein HWV62_11636, partial [Athelia sp. TMB]
DDSGGIHHLKDENPSEWKNISLSWMMNEAIMAGLILKIPGGDWLVEDLCKKLPVNSLMSKWWPLEWLPLIRATRRDSKDITRRPNRGRGRMMYPGQKIHASVAYGPAGYTPRAVFIPDQQWPEKWEQLVGQGKSGALGSVASWRGCLDMDVFDINAAPTLVELIRIEGTSRGVAHHILKKLDFIASLQGGKNAIAEVPKVLDTLTKFLPHGEPTAELLLPSKKPTLETPELFMAVLKLLADLAISATPNSTLKEEVERALLGPFVCPTLVYIINNERAGERRPSSLISQYAKIFTALAPFSDVISAILNIQPSPICALVTLLGTSESAPAMNALAALKVSRNDLKELYQKADQLTLAVKGLVKLLRGAGTSDEVLAAAALMLSSIAAIGREFRAVVRVEITLSDGGLSAIKSNVELRMGPILDYPTIAG